MKEIEVTILIPCLNEEKTIGICIQKAKQFLKENGIEGEILVINNGSTDDSEKIAKQLGARVEEEKIRGYGAALIKGSKLAKGKYVIMGDADDSYNFLEIMPIYEELQNGFDFVIGNRYQGNLQKGAMKLTHRYIGTPILSYLARKKYHIAIGDFNCGLRGYDTEKIRNLQCQCMGMEYATELIVRAKQKGLRMKEVPINFYKDGRDGKSHLRTMKDGMRHLRMILKHKK